MKRYEVASTRKTENRMIGARKRVAWQNLVRVRHAEYFIDIKIEERKIVDSVVVSIDYSVENDRGVTVS